jgi:hypothetical protein
MYTHKVKAAPDNEEFHPTDLEDDLTRHHSKLRFLHNIALSLVETDGCLKLDNEGVLGLALILGDLCEHTEGMQKQVIKAYASRKGAQ